MKWSDLELRAIQRWGEQIQLATIQQVRLTLGQSMNINDGPEDEPAEFELRVPGEKP
jgi:hypothetical protein